MNDIWFIADTHFGHAKIIEYENRPFSTVQEMDTVLIDNWNRLVKPEDEIWHLGDFALADITRTAELVRMLHGHKRLVLGNHDTRSKKRYLELGFEIVSDGMEVASLDLTHVPREAPIIRRVNVHGHVHSNIIAGEHARRYYCVSVENTGYQPIHMDQILDDRQDIIGP